MIGNSNDLTRHNAFERTNHWIVAVCFVLAALSGMSLFHPFFWPLSLLFGGGVWTRIIHPFIGLLLVASFVPMFVRFRGFNRMKPADWDWIKRVWEMAQRGDDRNMPPQEKYNGAQKLIFWAACAFFLLMAFTGLAMWRAYFTFPVTLVRFAVVIHAAIGAVFIVMIILHIYAAIWVRGTINAMLYGTVSRAWAKQHHKIWYRQMTER
ncbi:MAG: formate dehydrogenase subunit gamma [Syntrophobacter sp.]